MDDPAKTTNSEGLTWKFPRTFWIANIIELFERAAYYGMFIFAAVFLVRDVGFTDPEKGIILGCFSCMLYFLPTFQGILADKIGFKSALCLAFAVLTAGYALLGAIPEKWASITALALIVFGGAIVKPVISGTAAKCSTDANRSRAMSLFYCAVNVGSMTGKWAVEYVRAGFDRSAPEELVWGIPGIDDCGLWIYDVSESAKGWFDEIGMEVTGYQAVNLYAAVMALVALVFTVVAYRNVDTRGVGKSMSEVLEGFGKVLGNLRFLSLILIVGGFWIIQVQLYATMPNYLLRMTDEFSKPGWIANVNPLVVVIFVVPITYFVRKLRPITSIGIALLLIPLSPLPVALAPQLGLDTVAFLGFEMHPLVFLLIIGIFFQGIAECFLSPRFLEYASKQAPPDEVGLYMGYSHLTSAISWGAGFLFSGWLLDAFCPAPDVVAAMSPEEAAHAYDKAHYIWFFWFGVGILAFIALLIFKHVTDKIDARKAADPNES